MTMYIAHIRLGTVASRHNGLTGTYWKSPLYRETFIRKVRKLWVSRDVGKKYVIPKVCYFESALYIGKSQVVNALRETGVPLPRIRTSGSILRQWAGFGKWNTEIEVPKARPHITSLGPPWESNTLRRGPFLFRVWITPMNHESMLSAVPFLTERSTAYFTNIRFDP